MTSDSTHDFRELDRRVSDGIEVRLLWSTKNDRLLVAVNDTKIDDAFTIEISEPRRALDAFHHPFAYAADREPSQTVHEPSTPVPS